MKQFLFSLFLFISVAGFATHNRAGEILYTRIAPFNTVVAGVTVPLYTYSIVIITFTDDGPGIADRCEDTVYFGDGQRAIAHRINGVPGLGSVGCGCGNGVGCGEIVINEPNYRVKKNIYSIVHSYPGQGYYTIRMFDPNRNAGVANIPNSVNQPFYVESLLVINPYTGANTSPQFLYDPIDRACVYKCFTHNPGAYDPDGDSLSYEITTCRVNVGETVPGYTYPDPGPGGEFDINATTGLLKWCSPQAIAQFNIAFIVHEWRKNSSGNYEQIGYVLRDMQVVVESCSTNNPPIITVPADTCVEAGTLIIRHIKVTDPIDDTITVSSVTLTGESGAFNVDPPVGTLANTIGSVTHRNPSFYSTFTWQTTCDHVREQPYESVFKARDNGLPSQTPQTAIKLTTFASFNIKVVPPSVKNVTATPMGSSIKISWQLSTCSPANNPLTAYKIYRKNDCSAFSFTPCQTGMPPSTGYTFIGQTAAAVNTFTDNNNGNGLIVGQNYSYIVVAEYEDGTETFGSAQVCSRLKRDIPLILNVDVRTTKPDTGKIRIRWTRPLVTAGNFDTLAIPGPYSFVLKYKESGANGYTPVYTSTKPFLALDTDYVQSINTQDGGKDYSVDFFAGTVAIGSSQLASSIFLSTTPGDRKVHLQWSSNTPWTNSQYVIWRKNPASQNYVVIDTTSSTGYTDSTSATNLIANRNVYCYKVESIGAYSDPSIYSPLFNFSEESCVTPVDATPPCTPTLNVQADCALGTATVSWNDVRTLACGDDVLKYNLYYKPTVNDAYAQVATGLLTSYKYDGSANDSLISGCYAIEAVDSSGNVSPRSVDFCLDNCPIFELPNVFTPNKDGVNEFFQAIRVRQIKQIDLNVYDRWGNLIYKTTDPYFHWDGVSIISNQPVSDGTLFYICDVFERRLTGNVKRTLKGFVQVFH